MEAMFNVLRFISKAIATYGSLFINIGNLLYHGFGTLSITYFTIKNDSKYQGLNNRINNMRDLVIQLIAEVLMFKKEFSETVKDNPDFAGYNSLAGEVVKLEGFFDEFKKEVKQHLKDELINKADTKEAFENWIAESGHYKKIEHALYGAPLVVTTEELIELLRADLEFELKATKMSSDVEHIRKAALQYINHAEKLSDNSILLVVSSEIKRFLIVDPINQDKANE